MQQASVYNFTVRLRGTLFTILLRASLFSVRHTNYRDCKRIARLEDVRPTLHHHSRGWSGYQVKLPRLLRSWHWNKIFRVPASPDTVQQCSPMINYQRTKFEQRIAFLRTYTTNDERSVIHTYVLYFTKVENCSSCCINHSIERIRLFDMLSRTDVAICRTK